MSADAGRAGSAGAVARNDLEGYTPVCAVAEVERAGALRVDAEGRALALFHAGEWIYALDDRCPHAGASLAEGLVRGGTVTCSWHCASFELATGASLDSISRWDAEVWPVEVRDGRVWVRLPEEEST